MTCSRCQHENATEARYCNACGLRLDLTCVSCGHAPGRLTRFVGRDHELEQLWRAQELAGKGRGQVAAVVGEAGVGKPRLVYEFTQSHRMQGWLVLEADAPLREDAWRYRYPGEPADPGESEVRHALEQARIVVGLIQERLPASTHP